MKRKWVVATTVENCSKTDPVKTDGLTRTQRWLCNLNLGIWGQKKQEQEGKWLENLISEIRDNTRVVFLHVNQRVRRWALSGDETEDSELRNHRSNCSMRKSQGHLFLRLYLSKYSMHIFTTVSIMWLY